MTAAPSGWLTEAGLTEFENDVKWEAGAIDKIILTQVAIFDRLPTVIAMARAALTAQAALATATELDVFDALAYQIGTSIDELKQAKTHEEAMGSGRLIAIACNIYHTLKLGVRPGSDDELAEFDRIVEQGHEQAKRYCDEAEALLKGNADESV
jgi:hypothetical protein